MKLKISGQIYGGKNNINITKKGKRYPNKEWQEWRDGKIWELKRQIIKMKDFETFTEPMSIIVRYTAGDNRRRDTPAILDSIYHLLEKTNVVDDDALIGGFGCDVIFINLGFDKEKAGVELELMKGRGR